MAPQRTTLERATEVFARGFSFTRSFTYPYEVVKSYGLTIMRDLPGRRTDTRNSEFIVCGMSPREGLAALKKARFFEGGVCVIDGPSADLDPIRDEYKRAGLRLTGRQPFFVADPRTAQRYKSPIRIVRVTTMEQARAVQKVSRRRPLLPEHLGREDTIRLYAAFDGKSVVGQVSSIPVDNDAWVSNLFVVPSHRGRGIGRALMSVMLQDDAGHGVRSSVLLSSTAGARLYPHVGYERIGTLQLFVPGRNWKGL